MKYLYLTLLCLFLSVSSYAIVPIAGSKTVCVSFTTKLSDATAGGTWSSSATIIASVDTNGLVTGHVAGTSTITYAIGAGHATLTVTVNPYSPLIGNATICSGLSTVLTDAIVGGVWTSGNTLLATVGSAFGHATVTGVSAGTVTISYTLSTGCVAIDVVTINPLPGPILGTKTLCVATTTTLSDVSFNGTWASSFPGIAKAGLLSGVITGITAGPAIITYTLPTGCLGVTTVTVNPLPGAIAGILHTFHQHQVTLTDPSPGGTWAVNYPSIATIGSSSGTVTGISGGFADITYSLTTTGCKAYAKFSVDGFPDSGATFPLMAWWPFCNDLTDHSGKGNTLNNGGIGSTAAADTISRYGAANAAYKFDGVKNMLYIKPAFPLVTASGDFTYSCWIYPEAIQSSIIIFDGNPALDGIGLVMNNGVTGTPGARVGVQVGGGGLYLSTPLPTDGLPAHPNGLFMYHNLILEKFNGNYTLYIDSMFEGFFVSPLTTPTQGFAVGNDITAPGGGGTYTPYNGLIDDIALFNDGITPQQRLDLYYYNPDIASFSLGNDTSICNNVITLAPTPQEPGTFYSWSTPVDTLDTTVVVYPPTLGPGIGTTYSLSITKPYGCTFTDNIIVYKNPLPVNIGNDTSICSGDTVIANATYTGGRYLWNTGATTATIPITLTGSYWVTVDSSFCIGTDTINVQAFKSPVIDLGPDVYSCFGKADTIQNIHQIQDTGMVLLWSNGTTGDSLITGVSGTFWLNIVNGGCSRTDTIHVLIVYDTFSLASKDTAICQGRFVTANATYNPIVHYQWTPTTGILFSTLPSPNITPDTSATYVLTGTYPGCADIKYSFHIDVQPNPIVNIGGNRFICTYDTIHINALVSPNWYSGYRYSWSPVTNIDFPHDQNVVFRAGDSTDLILTVTTPAGCIGTDSAYIAVFPGQFDSLVMDVNVCPHDSVQLSTVRHTVGNTVGTVATYTWHPGIFVSDSTSANPWLHAINSAEYYAIGTSSHGCRDTIHFKVTVNPGAVIYLGDSVTIHPGQSYTVPTQTNCEYFSWSPAYGINDTNNSAPTLSPTLNTRYIVRAATEAGCYVIDSFDVRVNPTTPLILPNAFMPGTGPNGTLLLIKQGIAALNYFRIYNRWGVMVFMSDDINKGWDGTYKNVAQPFGVYVYEIEATTSIGQVFHQQGNVTLIR
jgi:uncharacterized protein YjdB